MIIHRAVENRSKDIKINQYNNDKIVVTNNYYAVLYSYSLFSYQDGFEDKRL